ncbi:MAG: hypothetical protein ACLT8A_13720 [Subdoligranulum sp.]
MLDNVGLRYPHRASGAKGPRTLRPLPLLRFAVSATAALTFAASSIICAFGLAAAAPRSPYRHLELCGIALAFYCRAGAFLCREYLMFYPSPWLRWILFCGRAVSHGTLLANSTKLW